MPKKQKSGLYRTKVKVGTDHTGKPIVKWISGKTQKELEDAKREVIARYVEGYLYPSIIARTSALLAIKSSCIAFQTAIMPSAYSALRL